MPRLRNIQSAISGRVIVFSPRSCFCCNKHIDWNQGYYCPCMVCTYCSERCEREDAGRGHSEICTKIEHFADAVRSRLRTITLFHNTPFLTMFEPNYRGEHSNRIEFYSSARENLIKQLMLEGCRRGHSAGEMANRSVSAFDVAISHNLDLLFIYKKNYKDVMNI